MLHNHHKMMTTTITRECKLAANRLTEFPLELTNLPNLHLLDLSLNQVDPDTGIGHVSDLLSSGRRARPVDSCRPQLEREPGVGAAAAAVISYHFTIMKYIHPYVKVESLGNSLHKCLHLKVRLSPENFLYYWYFRQTTVDKVLLTKACTDITVAKQPTLPQLRHRDSPRGKSGLKVFNLNVCCLHSFCLGASRSHKTVVSLSQLPAC